MTASAGQPVSTWASLRAAVSSWRTLSVVLLSFSSGMPLGLVWLAIPDWMRDAGLDIRLVGLLALAQLPWTFKVLWSPLMDRFVPPFLGRRRGWALITQGLLLLSTLALALLARGAGAQTWALVFACALLIAFAAASQDIAVDAYAVEVLERHEQGIAVGARTALYRAGMFVSGGLAISWAGRTSWMQVCFALSLLYLPMMLVSLRAPEPVNAEPAPRTLRDAVWLPFLGFLARHRALEILAFVVLYKLADNLAQALLRPFLIDMGYNSDERGLALTTVGLIAMMAGVLIGGALTTAHGLGRSLWLFGFLQLFYNLGDVLLAKTPRSLGLMVGAMGFETLCQGLGTGAFSVLLLRLTQRRFSATQYALFSALFGVGRVFAGPLAGTLVDALGWTAFFLLTIPVGVPGLVLLHRFAPFGVREPELKLAEPVPAGTVSLAPARLWLRGSAGALVTLVVGGLLLAGLAALRALRAGERLPIDHALGRVFTPDDIASGAQLAGLLVCALGAGVLPAAGAAARRAPAETGSLPPA